MLCTACGTAFEVESDGAHIRLAVVPAVLSPYAPSLVDVWLLPGEVSDRVEQVLGSAPVPTAEAPGVATPTVMAEVAVIATHAAPEAATVVALGAAAAVLPDLGSTQPNPALRHAPRAAAGGAAPPATLAPAPPEMTEDEAATLALHSALAEALQALPASAPRSDAMLADELAAALNVAPPNSAPKNGAAQIAAPLSPANGGAAPAARQLAGANGAAVDAQAAIPQPSATPVTPGGADHAITTSPAVTAVELAPGVAPLAASSAAATAPANASPVADASRAAEFSEQASRLHEYGNRLQLIQTALERSGASPDEARQAMANIVAAERSRQARFHSTLQWVAGSSVSVMIFLLAVAIGMSLTQHPPAAPVATLAGSTPAAAVLPPDAATATAAQAAATPTLTFNPIVELINNLLPSDVKIVNGPSPTPGPTSAVLGAIFPPTATLDPAAKATLAAARSGLPDWVSTLVPDSLTVLNVPTPSLDTTGPPNSACPVTPDNAASLFGGKRQYWSYDKTNVGWVLIVAGSPISLRLPANMSAGYLVIGATLEMRSVQGPATIHNVNFAAISCRA